ncbi:hypothetical protein [Lederbergia citrea]|uniref:hypothetical protein n=1 Tax=Lederbergia citrea TaxID=2833581 RepID=UPI001BCA3876|nr:hypothetical protein [Lederbergia citrea]MBS4178435.1 hypothetical protein [Lederbergia citrea]
MVKIKSVSALVSPDKHKTKHAGNPDFWSALACDLEGLGAEARRLEEGDPIVKNDVQ